MKIVRNNIIEYAKAWELQQEYFNALLNDIEGEKGVEEVLMICEHPHVYTLGRSGSPNNMLVDEEFLSRIGATYFKTDRGGDITYHGYGQIVVYPIMNLTKHSLSLKEYIYNLEQAIIDTIAEYGIEGVRLAGATGVWIEGDRKIAAIGVKASRYITMHGLALNVNTDLNYFNYINPCGFTDKGVTSIAKEIGIEVDKSDVEERFIKHFLRLFNVANS